MFIVALWLVFCSNFINVEFIHFSKMNNDGKKIAFSFTKVKKSALINKVTIDPKEKIEYVDCFDGSKGKFSYKGNVRNDELHKQELVIPMPISSKSSDVIKSRIEEKNKTINSSSNYKSEEIISKDNKGSQDQQGSTKGQDHQKNIEELAALEILREVKNGDIDNKETSKLVIEANVLPKEPSETDIDYENIPVTDFGLAMLRGMGWKPDLGIGKEPRIVDSVSPKLRPKGLGLGAQINSKTNNEKKNEEKESGKMSYNNSEKIVRH